MIKGYEHSDEELEEMTEFWRVGDINSMIEILEKEDGQTYFVFVGAMYLVEEPSIPSELEDKGYDVEFIY